MKKKIAIAVLLAAAIPGWAAPSAAQNLGRRGDVAFAADRLMGIYFYDEGPDVTAIGLGTGAPYEWYTRTRLGIDFFVIEQLSLGGSIAYFNVDGDGRGNGNDVDGFLFAPRIGYAIEIGRSFGFWPRGGITYRNVENDSELALTMEALFWGAPTPHFAITFGPVFDVGLVGDDSEARNIGLISAGILGWI